MQADPGTVTSLTSPLVGLIGSLGSAAAACFVVWIFMGFLKETAKRREEIFERFTTELEKTTRDNAQIISKVSTSLDNNTHALERIEATARVLSDRINGARPKGIT